MDLEEKELHRQAIADFRYSVVAELCNPYLNEEQIKALIKEKTGRHYAIPRSKKNSISAETIRKWMTRYRMKGKDGLLPKPREDRGRQRSFSDPEAEVLIDLLEKKPELTAKAAVTKLLREGRIQTHISSSALSRFISSHNLTRKDRFKKEADKTQLRFGFEFPLQSVQSDAMHGFPIPDGKGVKRKAILLAFLDDATRRIVFGRFDFSERSELFEEGIKHILKSHGKPGMLYTDNGATFVSNQTKRIVESLGIHLIHSRPYRPQGRGKVERFFRTVRQSFLNPLDESSIKSLDQLNHLFRTWLETEYHRQVHSAIGVTPLEAWLSKSDRIKPIDPFIDLDRAFHHIVTRKVYKDAVVTVLNKAFEVPGILIGKKVKISFDPNESLSRIYVSCDGRDYGEARQVDLYANAKVKRNHDFSGEVEMMSREQSGHNRLAGGLL